MVFARLFMGVVLLSTPAFAMAQETGSGDVMTDSGAILMERLSVLAEEALPLEGLAPPEKAVTAWKTEVEKYRERTQELRLRCHEELRASNRDTMLEKSAQCMRSDLLLEVTHRRKQLDYLLSMPVFMNEKEVLEEDVQNWADAAMAVVDGVDAGVFGSVEVLKEAKMKLHNNYRVPMLLTFTHHRIIRMFAMGQSLAAISRDAASAMEDPTSFLSEIVPCLESINEAMAYPGETQALASHQLREGMNFTRQCLAIIERASE